MGRYSIDTDILEINVFTALSPGVDENPETYRRFALDFDIKHERGLRFASFLA